VPRSWPGTSWAAPCSGGHRGETARKTSDTTAARACPSAGPAMRG
jgi:hypothetical protein